MESERTTGKWMATICSPTQKYEAGLGVMPAFLEWMHPAETKSGRVAANPRRRLARRGKAFPGEPVAKSRQAGPPHDAGKADAAA